MEEHSVSRQGQHQCVIPAPESLFGDVPDLDVCTAIDIAMNGVEWKQIDHIGTANLGDYPEYKIVLLGSTKNPGLQ